MTSIQTRRAEIAIAPSVVSLHDFYPSSGDIYLPTSDTLFKPDGWGKNLAGGIITLESIRGEAGFAHDAMAEVGSGTGINVAAVMTRKNPPKEFIATDYVQEAVDYTQEVVVLNKLLNVSVLQSDLLDNIDPESLKRLTVVFACIPQVPEADKNLRTAGDGLAHYYDPKGRPPDWNKFGLGLNAALIEQINLKAPQSGLLLNLAGRPGIGRLKQMFHVNGRDPQILNVTMVPQHLGTCLKSLAALERSGIQHFEFFKDAAGTQPIGAVEAEDIRSEAIEAGQDEAELFHNVYAIYAPGLTPDYEP